MILTRLYRHVVAAASVAVGAACGSDAAGPPQIGPPASIAVTTAPTANGTVKSGIGNLAVKVTDANGNGVSGVRITYFATGGGGIDFSPGSSVTDAYGAATTAVTLGTKTGTVQLNAYAIGLATPASATVTATPGPLVSLVTSPKSLRLAAVGDTVRISPLLRDEWSNVVSTAIAFAVADPTLVSVDPQGLVRALRAGGTTTITASASGRSDTVGIRVRAPGETACTGVATPNLPAVGAVLKVVGSAVCLTGAASADAEYTLVAYNASDNGSSVVTASITPDGAATPPTALRMPTSAPLLSRAPSGGAASPAKVLDDRFHQRLLTQARGLRRLFAPARSTWRARRSRSAPSGGAFSPSVSYSTVPGGSKVGDIVPLNVSVSACDDAVIRGFRVVAVGAKAVVLADTLNPANGFSDADYQRFATRFDTLVYPLDVDAFGAPSDIDGNGKVAVLFTKYVNELTPANSDSFIGGFFHPRDLFPSIDSNGLFGCATSNEGEMFYVLVPDPTGVVNGNRYTLGFVDTITVGVLAHEFQHLINAGRRLYVNTDAQDFEDTWLNEGLSHIAEELLYYHESGFQPRQRLNDAAIHSTPTRYAIFKADASSNLSRLLEYIEDPGASSPIDEDNDELSTRGATWAFLRYAVDRAFPSDAGVWSRFSNSIGTGLNTVAEGLLANPRPFLADFALANYLSDLGIGSDPRYVHASWNFRDIFSNTYGSRVNGVFTPLGYYPIKLVGAPDAVTTTVGAKGGSASYVRLTVAAGKEALLSLATGSGSPDPALVFSVIRTK